MCHFKINVDYWVTLLFKSAASIDYKHCVTKIIVDQWVIKICKLLQNLPIKTMCCTQQPIFIDYCCSTLNTRYFLLREVIIVIDFPYSRLPWIHPIICCLTIYNFSWMTVLTDSSISKFYSLSSLSIILVLSWTCSTI